MKLGTTSALHLPRPSVKLLKTPAEKAPKLMKVSIQPAKTSIGGWAAKATHHMTDGSRRQFNFTDPMTFGKHLTKISRAQWRHPQKNEAGSITHALDIG